MIRAIARLWSKNYEKKNYYCWNDFLLVLILFSWWLNLFPEEKKIPIIWSKKENDAQMME